MNKHKAIVLSLDAALLAVLIWLDQFTKRLAVLHLKDQDSLVLIPGVLELDYLENRGAAFGILQNQRLFLLMLGVVFLIVAVFFLTRIPEGRRYALLHILFVMIMAGGAGNMIDRFLLTYVVDFVSFVLIHFPVFNVADMYVVTATALLFILLLFVYKDEELAFLGIGQRSRQKEKE